MYIYMQDNYVNMQLTNMVREPEFYMGKITYLRPIMTSKIQDAT